MLRNRTSQARPDPWWTRRGRLALVTLLLVGLVILLIRSLLTPFHHPRTHLVLLTGGNGGGESSGQGPSDYVVDDLAAFLPLEPFLYRGPWGAGLNIWGSFRSRDELRGLGEQFAALPTDQGDVLIVYLQAAGVSDDGTPYLVTSADDSASTDEVRYPLRALLRQIQASTAGQLLLIVEAGRREYDPARGMLMNQFPRLLREEVRRLADPRLTVLCSHDEQQRSHLSHALRRSVFGYFVAAALQGAADENGDRVVSLDELHRFVTQKTADWVRQGTGGVEMQTPFLVRAGEAPRQVTVPLIAVASSGSERIRFLDEESMEDSAESKDASDNGSGDDTLSISPDSARPAAPEGLAGDDSAPRDSTELAAGTPAASTPSVPDDSQIPAESLSLEAMLHEIWALRDQLESRQEFGSRPQDYAPHLWNALQHELLHYERQFRTGSADGHPGLRRSLAQWLVGLREMALDRPLGSRQPVDLLRRIDAARTDRLFEFPAARSLAMAELSASRQNRPLPDDLPAARERYEHWITDGSRAELLEDLTELSPSAMEMPELRLAAALSARGYLDWETIQQALRVRRQAENSVARAWRYAEWLRPRTMAADQLRLEAERFLLDGIDFEVSDARSRWNEVAAAYRGIDQDRSTLQQAQALRNDLLGRVSAYLRWFHLRGSATTSTPLPGPRFEDLQLLLTELLEFCRLLDRPSPEQIDPVRDLTGRLALLRDKLEQPLGEEFTGQLTATPAQPGDSWQIEILLRTPLPRAEIRRRLVTAAAEMDEAWAQRFIPPPTSSAMIPRRQFGPEDWRRLEQVAELHRLVAALGVVPEAEVASPLAVMAHTDSRLEAILGQLRRQIDREPSDLHVDAGRWAAVSEFSSELRNFHQNLPGRLQVILESLPREAAGDRRGQASLEGGAALRLLSFIDPRDIPRFRMQHPRAFEEQGAIHDLLLWQRQRALAARLAADPEDFGYWTDVARRYAQAADTMSHQPSLSPGEFAPVAIEGSDSLSLALQQEERIHVTLHNRQAETVEVWLVMEFSQSVLDVRSRMPGFSWYPASDLPPMAARLAVAARRFGVTSWGTPPLDPFETRTPSLVLRPGQVETIPLLVRRRAGAPYPTRLAVTAFTRHDAARWSLPIELPAPRELEVALSGTSGTWSGSGGQWSLHPFPNRITTFQLALRNTADHQKVVNAELFAPAGPWGSQSPAESLSREAGERWLRTLTLGPPVATAKELVLPAQGEWVTVPLESPEEAPADAPASTESVTSDNTSSVSTVSETLLLLVTDLESRRKTVTRLDVAPQKPSRFLRPRVSYDPTRRRLEIEILPRDRQLLPREGVRVRAEIVPELASDAERRLDTTVGPANFRGEMHAEIAPEADKTVTLYLHVDGYPRAFIYRVPCSMRSVDIPADEAPLRVALNALPQGTVYSAPAGRIPVELQVDVPRGAFQQEGDFVEVGIDRRRDREFSGDATLRVRTDRRVVVTLPEVGAEGELLLATEVTDLQLHVTDWSRHGGRANVLARVMVGGTEAWSEPEEIILDGSAPHFRSVRLETESPAVIGTPLIVAAIVDDGLLSGVARVEAALDRDRSGIFPSEGSIPAQLESSGTWVATVPTDDLPRGAYNLLLQATDQVGNVSEVTKIRVQVLPEGELKPDEDSLRADVRGTVVFGRNPRPMFPVTLERLPDEEEAPSSPHEAGAETSATAGAETRTDAEGRFVFRKLPAGKYRVRAAGVVFNKPRSAETTLQVAPPQSPPPVELKLP